MKKILPGLTVLFTLVASTGIAAADAKCENVKITITNQFSKNNDHKNIKIVDLDYWDAEDGKWREEVTGNETVGYGDATSYTKNLEYVGGETGVKVRIHFKYNEGGTDWSGTFTRTSAAFKCVDNKPVAVTIQ